MDRADELFRDMLASGVTPDVITYSTLVKGYCQAGDIDQGFQVLKDMVKNGVHEPDEILYNSLLDGGGDVQALRPAGEHPRLHVSDFRVLPEPPDAAGFAAPRFDDHGGRCRAGRAHVRGARTGMPRRRVLREGRQRGACRIPLESAGARHAEAR